MQSTGWTDQELKRRAIELDLHARVRMAEWLTILGEIDHRDAARADGYSSTATWLAHVSEVDGRTARDYVQVARRLRAMPLVQEAFGEGRLSYAKVRALSRVAECEDERALLRVALSSTAIELERYVRQLRCAPSADPDVVERTRARRFLRTEWELDGSLRFFGSLPPDQGAALLEAVETKAAQLRTEAHDPCRPDAWTRAPIGARRADSLVELVTGGGVRTRIVLHADLESLACTARGSEPRAGKVLHLQDGPAIPSELARELARKAVVSVSGLHIDKLNLGRRTRCISGLQRRALELRDGRVCSMPGCHSTHGLEGHHITPWEHGGRTDLDNLCLICRFHHKLVHDRGLKLRRRKEGLTVKNPQGRELYQLPPPRLRVQAA